MNKIVTRGKKQGREEGKQETKERREGNGQRLYSSHSGSPQNKPKMVARP